VTRNFPTRVTPVSESILSKCDFGDIQAELKKRLLYSIYDNMVICALQWTLFEPLPPLPPLQSSRRRPLLAAHSRFARGVRGEENDEKTPKVKVVSG
jgi:hypothetical protein